VLYDPRLRPGMGWAEVEPLARAALREVRDGARLADSCEAAEEGLRC
jgi:hypothetical protein